MPYRFTESVPYLLNRAGVAVAERFTRRLEDYDVSLPMYRVLAVLRQTGTHTLGELSAMVSVEMSTLSRLIGTMAKRNLVTRDRPQDNARIVLIDLTDDGREMADKLMPIATHFEDTLVSNLDAAQVETLKALLRQVNQQVEKL
ncbi:MarR family winged helix-turn-helix transcriptional regulator [Pseudotabrizicola algicola]|uniref:MarR family transcriptional regulator n=1 Tax=Pseudotabrizicola algicola TaxID=2709381 RepID=A0A6B3RXU5_9RHOB|nr:MarR family transcriptional regulator [Pseudotabrizicola algicola]NEX47952.1 MarR family transcriptional regulator [Pseudotabrizicola algicola]